ncbi:protein SSUH2 homolog [Pelobates fuscus]|uniref:protein SSUH2 homolog n=1 Tax=Pelobates fuscus TaxID=191477 RepID=UPI002FE4BCEF
MTNAVAAPAPPMNMINSQGSNLLPGLNTAMAPSSLPSNGTSAGNLAHPSVGTVSQAAPISQSTDTVPGYEGIPSGDEDWKVIPPPAEEIPAPESVTFADSTKWIFPPNTENDAKQAFLKYAKRKCCYGTAPARGMTIKEFMFFGLHRYRLETFTESRACKWVVEHYVGQNVDSQPNGTVPRPWEIQVQNPAPFKDGMRKVTVPKTTSLKICPKCTGIGVVLCQKCNGTGRVECWICKGTGRCMRREMCNNCYGSGTECCRICLNSQRPCMGCRGKGQIINCIQLMITWKSYISEFIDVHNTEFPNELFKKATGNKIYMDEQVVTPLLNTPVPSITNASQNALAQHRRQFSSCRILRQRQSVDWLPFTKVVYTWKGNEFCYFVYGKENQIHTVTYPVKCCCVIT